MALGGLGDYSIQLQAASGPWREGKWMGEGCISPVWKITTGRRHSRLGVQEQSPFPPSPTPPTPDSPGNRLPTLSGHILFPRLIVGSGWIRHCVSLQMPFSSFFFFKRPLVKLQAPLSSLLPHPLGWGGCYPDPTFWAERHQPCLLTVQFCTLSKCYFNNSV